MSKVLLSFGMVVDIESDEIPAFAARIERTALDAMYAGIQQAISESDESFSAEIADELRQRFQVYGVSYSVQHELELPAE